MPGAKGQPQFASGDAPSLAAMLNAVGDYAALVGTRRVGTIVERDAYTTAGYATDGDEWYVPTNDSAYVRKSGTWVRVPVSSQSGTVTLPALATGTFSSPATVTFSTPFLGVPDVFVSTNAVRLTLAVPTRTATGFTWQAGNWSPANQGAGAELTWKAVG